MDVEDFLVGRRRAIEASDKHATQEEQLHALTLGALGVVKAARTLESVLRLKSRVDSHKAYLAVKHEFDLAVPELSRERQKAI